jgi:transposase
VRDIERKLDDHEVGKLLTTIDGIGPLTSACLIAELGDPACFRNADAIASYVGVAPRLRQSGQEALLRQSNNSVRKRPLAQGALDGGSQRRPLQSVAATVL